MMQLDVHSVCRDGSRISEGGVLIAGTDSSGGPDTEKFSRGCLQRLVSTNLNAYVSSGTALRIFKDICNFLVRPKRKKEKRSQFSTSIKFTGFLEPIQQTVNPRRSPIQH